MTEQTVNTIIGMCDRWLREKPRADALAAVVRLRLTMKACQSAYEEVLLNRTSPGLPNRHKRAKLWGWLWRFTRRSEVAAFRQSIELHAKTVQDLGYKIEDLEPTLEAYAREAVEGLRKYHQAELGAVSALSLAAQEMRTSPHAIRERLESVRAAADCPKSITSRKGEIGSDFEDTLRKLDAFIAKHFTPVEVHSASQRWF